VTVTSHENALTRTRTHRQAQIEPIQTRPHFVARTSCSCCREARTPWPLPHETDVKFWAHSSNLFRYVQNCTFSLGTTSR